MKKLYFLLFSCIFFVLGSKAQNYTGTWEGQTDGDEFLQVNIIQIGTTICRVKKLDGSKLYLEGLDAVDGTPVLDIKPWVKEFAPRGSEFQPDWITELMKGYWAPSANVETSPTMFDPVVLDTEHVKIRPLKTTTWEKLAEGLLYEGSFHATNWGMKTPADIKPNLKSPILNPKSDSFCFRTNKIRISGTMNIKKPSAENQYIAE